MADLESKSRRPGHSPPANRQTGRKADGRWPMRCTYPTEMQSGTIRRSAAGVESRSPADRPRSKLSWWHPWCRSVTPSKSQLVGAHRHHRDASVLAGIGDVPRRPRTVTLATEWSVRPTSGRVPCRISNRGPQAGSECFRGAGARRAHYPCYPTCLLPKKSQKKYYVWGVRIFRGLCRVRPGQSAGGEQK